MTTSDEILHELRSLSGKVTAIEHAIVMLMATHPERAKLGHAWRGTLPQAIDHFMTQEAFSDPDRREALLSTLARIGNGFDDVEPPQ